MTLLDGLRILDLSSDIAGPYATKMLADAGADVVKLEDDSGDPLRRWSASGARTAGDGLLFRFLNSSKRSVLGTLDGREGAALLAGADLVIEQGAIDDVELAGILEAGVPVVSVTPFGRSGPSARCPATEFTLQALCGSTGGRGFPGDVPLHAGGRLGEWIAGTYTAVAALAALRASRVNGRAEHVDLSVFECMCITMGGFAALQASLSGTAPEGLPRSIDAPSVEPTSDGLVGFVTVTGQQFQDFMVLIGQPEMAEDPRFATAPNRQKHRDEFLELVWAWTKVRTTDDVISAATALRIPVAPIGRPETLAGVDHFVHRGVYVPGADGSFVQPRPPYRVEGADPRPLTPAPGLGEHTGRVDWDPRPRLLADGPPQLPLAGLRVVDFTAFWAGPSATQLLAALGADVIKIESVQRPDGMRFASAASPGGEGWWEWSSVFHAVNQGKRGITLDLGSERGRALALDLIGEADVVIENFSPRVFDSFGLSWSVITERNPGAILVRMPAFGLDGPWRDRTGFAQTMEQASGLAWMTGKPDGLPVIPRGPCDPLAGMHATFALLAALEDRDRNGEGRFVEVPMIEAALNVASELVIEFSGNGAILARDGNRGPVAAPQGVYRCRGDDQWVAIAVATDAQWQILCRIINDPALGIDPALRTEMGRRRAHDDIDVHLSSWCLDHDPEEAAELLCSAGVPAAPVIAAHRLLEHPQLRARGFVERMDHAVVGHHEVPGVPFRFSSHPGPWFTRPAPMLGEHNDDVLAGALGLDQAEVADLRQQSVIGNLPVGVG